MIKIIDDKTKSIDEVFKGFEKINNDIKFKAFGKVTLKGKKTKKDNTVLNNDNDEGAVARELLSAPVAS